VECEKRGGKKRNVIKREEKWNMAKGEESKWEKKSEM
jgi:hypothetical protein